MSNQDIKYPHYFKSVSHLETVDVYRVLSLFQVNDPCIQHAIKKLLCAGDQVKKEVLDKDDYLPVCTQCLVTARVMM